MKHHHLPDAISKEEVSYTLSQTQGSPQWKDEGTESHVKTVQEDSSLFCLGKEVSEIPLSVSLSVNSDLSLYSPETNEKHAVTSHSKCFLENSESTTRGGSNLPPLSAGECKSPVSSLTSSEPLRELNASTRLLDSVGDLNNGLVLLTGRMKCESEESRIWSSPKRNEDEEDDRNDFIPVGTLQVSSIKKSKTSDPGSDMHLVSSNVRVKSNGLKQDKKHTSKYLRPRDRPDLSEDRTVLSQASRQQRAPQSHQPLRASGLSAPEEPSDAAAVQPWACNNNHQHQLAMSSMSIDCICQQLAVSSSDPTKVSLEQQQQSLDLCDPLKPPKEMVHLQDTQNESELVESKCQSKAVCSSEFSSQISAQKNISKTEPSNTILQSAQAVALLTPANILLENHLHFNQKHKKESKLSTSIYHSDISETVTFSTARGKLPHSSDLEQSLHLPNMRHSTYSSQAQAPSFSASVKLLGGTTQHSSDRPMTELHRLRNAQASCSQSKPQSLSTEGNSSRAPVKSKVEILHTSLAHLEQLGNKIAVVELNCCDLPARFDSNYPRLERPDVKNSPNKKSHPLNKSFFRMHKKYRKRKMRGRYIKSASSLRVAACDEDKRGTKNSSCIKTDCLKPNRTLTQSRSKSQNYRFCVPMKSATKVVSKTEDSHLKDKNCSTDLDVNKHHSVGSEHVLRSVKLVTALPSVTNLSLREHAASLKPSSCRQKIGRKTFIKRSHAFLADDSHESQESRSNIKKRRMSTPSYVQQRHIFLTNKENKGKQQDSALCNRTNSVGKSNNNKGNRVKSQQKMCYNLGFLRLRTALRSHSKRNYFKHQKASQNNRTTEYETRGRSSQQASLHMCQQSSVPSLGTLGSLSKSVTHVDTCSLPMFSEGKVTRQRSTVYNSERSDKSNSKRKVLSKNTSKRHKPLNSKNSRLTSKTKLRRAERMGSSRCLKMVKRKSPCLSQQRMVTRKVVAELDKLKSSCAPDLKQSLLEFMNQLPDFGTSTGKTGLAPNVNSSKSASNSETKINEKISCSSQLTRSDVTKMLNIENQKSVESVIPSIMACEIKHVNISDQEGNEVSDLLKIKNSTLQMSASEIDVKMDSSYYSTKKRYAVSAPDDTDLSLQDAVVVIRELDTVDSKHFLKSNEKKHINKAFYKKGSEEVLVKENIAESCRVEKCPTHNSEIENRKICAVENILKIDDKIGCEEFDIAKIKIETICTDEPNAIVDKITCIPYSGSEKLVEGYVCPKKEKNKYSKKNLEDLNSKNDESNEESVLGAVASIQPPFKSETATVSSSEVSFKSEKSSQLSHFTRCHNDKTTMPSLLDEKPGIPCIKNLVMFKLVPVLEGGEPDYDLNSLIPVNGYFVPGSSQGHILLPHNFLQHFNIHEWSPKEKATNSPLASIAEPSSSKSVTPLPKLKTNPTFPEQRLRAHSLTSTPIKTHSILPELGATLGTWDMLPETTPSTDLPAHHPGVHLQHPPSTPSPSVGESSMLAHRKLGPLEGLQMSPSPSWNSTTPSSSPLLLSSSSLSAWNISSPISSNQQLQKQQLPSLRAGQDLISPPVSSSSARSCGQELQSSLDMYNPNSKTNNRCKPVEPTPSKNYVSKQSILDSMAYDLNKYGNIAYSAGQSDFMEKLNDVTQINPAKVDWKLSDAGSGSHSSVSTEHARYPSGQVTQNVAQDSPVTPRTPGHTWYASSSYSEVSGCESKQEQVVTNYGQLREEVGFTHTVNLDRSLPYIVSPTLQPRSGPANTPPAATSTANKNSYLDHHFRTSSIEINSQLAGDKCGSVLTSVRDVTEEHCIDGKKKARRRKMQYECYTENNVKKCRCLVCGKSLGAATIYRHLRTHDPDYKICCHLCNKEYTQRQSLELHLQRVHPDHLSQNHVPIQDPASEEDLPSFDHNDGLPYQLRDIELDQNAQLLPEETLQQLVNEPHLLSSQSFQDAAILKRAGPGANLSTASDKSVVQNLSSGIGAAQGQRMTPGQRPQVRQVQSNKRLAEMETKLHNIKSSLDGGSVTFTESLRKNGYAAKQQFEYIHDRVHSDTLLETDGKGREIYFRIPEKSGRLTEKNIKELSPIEFEDYDCKSREAVNTTAESQSVLSTSQNLLSPLADMPYSPGFVANTSSCDSMEESNSADLIDQSQLESGAGKKAGKYPCEICHAKLSSRNGYTIHKRRHSTVMTRFCKFCNKGFHTGQEVRSHERTHTGEKPYQCNICYAVFAHSGSCVSHKKGHKKRGETTPFPIVDGLIQYPPTFKVLKPQGGNNVDAGGPKKKKKYKKKPENLETGDLEDIKSSQNDGANISPESSGIYAHNSGCELSTLTASCKVMQDQQDIPNHTSRSPQPEFQGSRGISQNQPSRLHMGLVDEILPRNPPAEQDGPKSQTYVPGQSYVSPDFNESSHQRTQVDKVAEQHNYFSLDSYLPGSASTSDYPTESFGSVSSILLNTSTDTAQYFEGNATLDDIDSNEDFKNYMMPQQHVTAASYSQGLGDLGQQQTDCGFPMASYKTDPSPDTDQKLLQHYDFPPPSFLATGGSPSTMAVAECGQSRQATLTTKNLPSYISSSLDTSQHMYYYSSADYKRTDGSSVASQKYPPLKLNAQLSGSHGYYQYQQSPSYFASPDDYQNTEDQLRPPSVKSDGRYVRTESYSNNQFVSPSFQASRYSYPQIQDGALGQITAGTPQSLPTIDSFTRDSRKNSSSQYH